MENQNTGAEEVFLPRSLVNLVLKLANSFEIAGIDQFSLMDTLSIGLFKLFNASSAEELEKIDEKQICLLIVNIVRVTEKFNKAEAKLTKLKLASIFPGLDITDEEFNQHEFKTFKMLDFQIKDAVIVEEIHKLIENQLSQHLPKKYFLVELSLDILRLLYLWRSEIYDL